MKLYTEEQVREAMYQYISTSSDLDEVIDVETVIIERLTPIELPSDEEIEELRVKVILYNDVKRTWWKVGAKWIKEQILNQNK